MKNTSNKTSILQSFLALALIVFLAWLFPNQNDNISSDLTESIDLTALVQPQIKLSDINEGTLVRKNGDSGLYEVLPMLNTSVSIRIQGMVATTTVDQAFTNSCDEVIEAVYVFPLPHDAAVHDMKMIIGDRLIQGIIKEKEEARKTYDKARKEGKRASLTEQERPNIFTNSVANLMPGDHIIVRLQYVQPLTYEDGRFSLRFPMVVAPRFIPGNSITGYSGSGWAMDTDIVQDASRITPPVVPPGMRSGNNVSISILVDAGLPIEGLSSSSHDIEVDSRDNNSWEVSLRDQAVIPNKDFIFEYFPVRGSEPRAAVFGSKYDGENYFMILTIPSLPDIQQSVMPKEIVFVIDVSSSMSGISIDQARAGLNEALDRLNPGDYFNIIQFNDSYQTFSPRSLSVNYQNLRTAHQYVNSLRADRGTMAQPALKHALTLPETVNAVKMVVFITDGAVGNENQLMQLLDSHLGRSRLFAIGIGSAPNGHLLDKVTKMGHGVFTYISHIQEISLRIGELFNKIENPVLTDIQLNISADTEIFPSPLPDLFASSPLVVYGKTSSDQDKSIQLTGRIADSLFKMDLPLPLSSISKEPAIPTLWAREKISGLMDDFRLGDKHKKQAIIDLGIKYKLLTSFTSFVAVEHKIVNPSGDPLKSVFPTELPEGWEYDKVFGLANTMKMITLPRTATKMPLLLLFGLFTGCLGLILRKVL